jgi:hypothetical protein
MLAPDGTSSITRNIVIAESNSKASIANYIVINNLMINSAITV